MSTHHGQQKRPRTADAGGSGGGKRSRGEKEPRATDADEGGSNGDGGGSKAAKKLLKQGVSAQRLETFAKLGKEGKKVKKKGATRTSPRQAERAQARTGTGRADFDGTTRRL